MRLFQLKNKIGAAILGLSFVLAAGVATQAQYPYDRGRQDYRYDQRNYMFQRAQEQGFRDGVMHGRNDGQLGRRYDPRSTGYYKRANNGYDRSFNDRDGYQRAYREAFLRGYADAYRRATERYRR